MKKRNVMMVAMMMVSTFIFAQRTEADTKAREDKRAEYMKKELSLSDDQVAKVKALNQTYSDKYRKVWRDSTMKREAAREEMKKINDQRKADLKKVLTEKQYTQWTELQAKRMGGRTHGLHSEAMKKELGLNDAQLKKIKAIDDQFGEKRKVEMKKLNDAKMAELKSVLTPEQYAKLTAMKAKHAEKKKKGFHHGPHKG